MVVVCSRGLHPVKMKLLILATILALAAADVSHIVGKSEKDAQILRQELDTGVEGQYKWAIETDNGIAAEASGSLKQISAQDEPAQVVQGSAQWTAPNGEIVQLSYSADENGYQAQGSHIPTPPPIPDHVVRSLAYIRDHPPPQDKLA